MGQITTTTYRRSAQHCCFDLSDHMMRRHYNTIAEEDNKLMTILLLLQHGSNAWLSI